MFQRLAALALLLAFLQPLARADVDVGSAPVPDWVEAVALEPFVEDRRGAFRNGVAFHLSDRQVQKTPQGFDFAYRFVYEVTDRSGLEQAASITQEFDPSDETLAFNFVRVTRNGATTDRLPDAEVTILRQEDELDNSLVDGRVTALIHVEDIRVGDVVDYSVSGTVAMPLWPDDFFDWTYVEWPVPVAKLHYRILVPDGITVHSRSVATDVRPTITKQDGWTAVELVVRDPDPLPQEDYLPRDWVPYGFVAFTTMDAWSDIVDWALPYYDLDESLPDDFAARLDAIAAQYDDPHDRAVHALRLVQDDIRYLGIEIGLGSHVPRAPATTLKRGYGDCKDKSVLLVAALRHLGIPASPALASLGSGPLLPQLPPSVNNFDHVIVGIDVGAKTLWVDPTLSHQGGLADNLVDLGYGYVLPIKDGQETLVEIEQPVSTTPDYEVFENFAVPGTGETGLRLEAEFIYRNAMAEYARARLAAQGYDTLSRDFLNFYAANYPGMTADEAFSVSDDVDANEIVYRASYVMDATSFRDNGFDSELPIFATAVQDEIPRQLEAGRRAPLAIPYGVNYRHRIRIDSPTTDFGLPDDTVKTVNGIQYARRFSLDGDAFVLDYTLRVAEKSARPATARKVTELGDEIAEDSDLVVYLNVVQEPVADLPDFNVPLDAATKNGIRRVAELIDEDEQVAALTTLNGLLDKHPEPTDVRGYLQHEKALVLYALNRRRSAYRAFEDAFEIADPHNDDSYFHYMNVLRDREEDERLLTVLQRMLARSPNLAERLNVGWFANWHRKLGDAGREAEADAAILALATAAHAVGSTDEDLQWVFRDAIDILLEQNDAELATAYLGRLREPDILIELLTNRSTATLWSAAEAQAGSDLSIAIKKYVDDTFLQANLSPDEFDTHTRHIMALRGSGRSDDAVRYASLYRDNWPRIEAVGEDAFWFINEAAYALMDVGRFDDALQLMQRLVDIGLLDNGKLVPMGINRAQMLMHTGDFAAALEAAGDLEEPGEEFANDYGWMWIYNVQACSLHQLGRKDEAHAVLSETMTSLADENPAAMTKTLLCLEDYDRAAATLIERLGDPEKNSHLIPAFSETMQSGATPPFLQELRRRASELRSRQDVRDAFDRVGRSISIAGAPIYWGEF